MAEKAGLDAKNLTSHSGRKRMIQKLNDEGVPPTHIMQISGHKNVQSLNNYSTLSEWQEKKNMSNILSGYPGVPGSSGYQVGISSALTLNATKTVQESTTQQPLTIFQGASIQGGTFNISVNTLNESPTLSLHSQAKVQKSTSLCYWIRQWLNNTLSYLLISYLDLRKKTLVSAVFRSALYSLDVHVLRYFPLLLNLHC